MSIELILGCMFSGKTTELFRRVKRCRLEGSRTIIYKYAGDTRYAGEGLAASHDKITEDAVSISSFDGVDIPDVDVIGIDEGQFYKGCFVDFVTRSANQGKRVIIAGLNGDFKLNGWKNIQELIPLSENTETLHAVCLNCKGRASFTKKIDASDGTLEVIGGADKYLACCRKCFNL